MTNNVEPGNAYRYHENNAANNDGDGAPTMPSFPPTISAYGSRAKSLDDDAYVQMDDDDDMLARCVSRRDSFADSVMTAEGLQDPEGFWIVCSVVLVGDMTRGIAFPIMWPLVEALGGNAIWMGYVVSGFSLGRIIISPFMGKWSIDYGYTKTLFAETTILLTGCILFAQAYAVGSLHFLVFSQIVIGIGSGTLGISRAYVAEITATRQRTKYMALLAAVQYGAFTVTPIFGSLFIYLLNDKSYQVGFFIFNQYSAVAYFMASLCVVTLVLLLTKFIERQRAEPAVKINKSQRRMVQDELANRATRCGLSIYNAALLGLMILNVTTKGSLGAFETMGISFAQSYFNLEPHMAATIISINGGIGVCVLLSTGFLCRFLTDVQMILGGISLFAVGAISFSWLQSIAMGANNSLVHYFVATFMIYGVGYPIGHTALIGLFSKGKIDYDWTHIFVLTWLNPPVCAVFT